jgi:hypothetical protein
VKAAYCSMLALKHKGVAVACFLKILLKGIRSSAKEERLHDEINDVAKAAQSHLWRRVNGSECRIITASIIHLVGDYPTC